MMKCFTIFKDKPKTSNGKSAPELNTRRRRSGSKEDSGGTTKSAVTPRIQDMFKEVDKQNLRVFSLSELGEATSNFNRLLKIGEGGFGSVYKGSIKPANGGEDEFTIVAIKKLNTQGLQGHKQWIAEVRYLGVLSHPNLVKLLGYCSVDGARGIYRLLVYEYMPNKSLEDHLFNRAMPTIPWITRLNIMLGAAQGMTYLHEGLEVQVIYRDFKSSNVLLDKEFNAKLSDFGLAREGPTGDQTHVSTAPVGTRGYAAPEYVETGHLTIKSDIWSFGVVLYELLTGRRTLERNRPAPEQKLLEWVKQFPSNSRRFSMIMDPRLQNQYSLDAARRVAMLADNCLNKNPKDRPAMSEVVEILKQAVEESKVTSSDVRSSPLRINQAASNKPLGAMEMKDATRQIAHIAQG